MTAPQASGLRSPPSPAPAAAEPGLRAALAGILPEEALALMLFVALGLVVFTQFSLRYAFGHALPWGEEAARALLVAVVFAGGAAATARGTHICVDGTAALFGPRLAPLAARLASLASALFFGHAAWLAADVARRVWPGSMATLPLSRGWIYAAVAAALAVASLRALVLLWRGAAR